MVDHPHGELSSHISHLIRAHSAILGLSPISTLHKIQVVCVEDTNLQVNTIIASV